VFQQDAVFLWRKVRKNIEFGLEVRGMPRSQRKAISDHYLNLVQLENFADFYPKELSGGMKKRVAIAMVLANQPEVLLADEPFGSLDYPTKVGLQHILLNILAEEKRTTLFVTHDIEEALFLSDTIVVLLDGRIAETVQIPFARPRRDSLRGDGEFQRLKMELWRYLM
jgi:NitT/TauT family transport system ATP-binding protein